MERIAKRLPPTSARRAEPAQHRVLVRLAELQGAVGPDSQN